MKTKPLFFGFLLLQRFFTKRVKVIPKRGDRAPLTAYQPDRWGRFVCRKRVHYAHLPPQKTHTHTQMASDNTTEM